MSVPTLSSAPAARRLPVPRKRRSVRALLVGLLALVCVAALHWMSWDKAQVSLSELVSGWHGMWNFLVGDKTTPGAIPPKWDWNAYVWPGIQYCLVTLGMGIIGTTFSVPFAFVLAYFGSRATTRNPVLYWVARGIASALRAVPVFVWGLIFVTAVGLGPFPGALALLVHNSGVMGKLWSEAMDEVDPGPVEALRTSGASNAQTALHVVFPSVTAQFSSLWLYRLDVNIRDATLLGIVGAGGIGFYITNAIQLFQFSVMSTYIVLVLVMIFSVDIVSALLRRRLARR